jgi:hypothetical protein
MREIGVLMKSQRYLQSSKTILLCRKYRAASQVEEQVQRRAGGAPPRNTIDAWLEWLLAPQHKDRENQDNHRCA